jgi:hypothetical protein
MEMKSLSMRVLLGVFVILLLQVICPSAASSEVFLLEGLEIAKGIDIGSVRIGTSFAGKVLDASGEEEQGFWSVSLNHRGAKNIEVCGGTNDIVSLRLVVCFTKGPYDGNQLVLGMTDLRHKQDVFWDFDYAGIACELGGVACDPCSPEAARIGCARGRASNLAVISDISLVRSKGSTLDVARAMLTEGQLCHYYPIIPRVFGKLVVDFR